MITKPKSAFIKDAIYLSYTSLSDFLKCPRAYFLKNIYRDPQTGNRIQIASPYLTLGSIVHDSIKWYLQMQGQVAKEQLEAKFRNLWLKYSGKKGGFSSKEEEAGFGRRGVLMVENFFKNAKVLENKQHDIDFPKYLLQENVILIGNFDFIGEKEDGTLHVLDFKTGAGDAETPLQLYIYAILAEANLGKPVSSVSYWYLDRDDSPKEIVLDPLEPKIEWLMEKGKQLKQAIDKGEWICLKGDEMCNECRIYSALTSGKGEFQFTDYRYKKDVYYLPHVLKHTKKYSKL